MPEPSLVAQGTDNASLLRRLEFERLLSEISTHFINLPAEQIDGHINKALSRVGGFLGFNLCAVAKFSGQGIVGEVTHIWAAEGLPPIPPGLTQLDFPWVAQQLTQRRSVHLTTLNDLPQAGRRDRETYERLGIRSTYNWALQAGGAVLGCLGLNSVGNVRPFPAEFEQGLELLAQTMASALDRARADLALRESEARLNLAADSAGLGLWSLKLANGEYWITDKTRQLLHLPPGQRLTFELFLALVHPEDQAAIRQVVEEVVHTKKEGSIEYRVIRPDGILRWMSSSGRVLCTATGEPDSLMGVTLDITERKESEEILREAQGTLKAIIDSTADMIWSVDPSSFGLLTFNAGLCNYFFERRGIHLEKGMKPEDLFPAGEYVQRWRSFYQRALRDGPFTTEYLVYANSNVLQLSFSVVKRGDRIFGVSVFGKDVTEQKKAERDAQELRDNLVHLTRVNTLGALSGSLAHELNQPLGIILSNAQAAQEMLDQDPPDVTEVQAILKDIVAADHRAGEVIGRLRALLKRGEIKLQPLQLNEVIQEVLHLVRADLIGRGVTLVQELAPDLPLVSGDRIQLQQLVLNLVINAMDAMAENSPGSRRLHLRTELCHGHVRSSVRDEGSGFSENPERLFQPFYTTKTKGLGMGLAICKSIVVAHHGRIWAERHPARGAVFYFELPVVEGMDRVVSNQ